MGGIGGSVRTSLSMQYFPRFFFLYFMVFHIYFFSYTYGIISQYALFQMHVQVCCPQFYVFKAFFSSLLLLPTIAKHVECFSNNSEVAGNLENILAIPITSTNVELPDSSSMIVVQASHILHS
jgi:hypothetical protein